MQHKCKVTVLRRELFKDLQENILPTLIQAYVPFTAKVRNSYLSGTKTGMTSGQKGTAPIAPKPGTA